jgi:GT2 family glycosyltransferase
MPNNKPLISICIANYNGMEIIDECIRSVLEQQGDISTEILVHDDASTDGSLAHIRANYPAVVLIESAENVGFCIANNRMVARARGQFILLLNNDAALYPDALQSLLAEVERLGQPAILTLPQYDATSGALVDRGCLLDPFFNPVPNLDPKRSDVAMVIGACLWIPKTLWDELEGFPEWFDSVAEDMYLCCRARLAGREVRVLAVSGYRHCQGASFGGNKPQDGKLSTTFRRRHLSERNKLRVMVLMSPGLWLLWMLPLHLALSVAETLTLCLASGRLDYLRRVHWPAWREAWQARAKLVQGRQHIQQTRRATAAEFAQAFTAFPRKLQLLWKYGMPRLK